MKPSKYCKLDLSNVDHSKRCLTDAFGFQDIDAMYEIAQEGLMVLATGLNKAAPDPESSGLIKVSIDLQESRAALRRLLRTKPEVQNLLLVAVIELMHDNRSGYKNLVNVLLSTTLGTKATQSCVSEAVVDIFHTLLNKSGTKGMMLVIGLLFRGLSEEIAQFQEELMKFEMFQKLGEVLSGQHKKSSEEEPVAKPKGREGIVVNANTKEKH